MRKCKICGVSKDLSEYTPYKKYPTKFGQVCKECKNKKAREKNQKFRDDLIRLNKEKEEIIREFNTLELSQQMLNLLIEGYDISWNVENIITFNKAENIFHIKNATKRIYDIVFARYCIELEKKL